MPVPTTDTADTARSRQTTDIENRFSFHPATDVTGPRHDTIRAAYRTLAHHVAGSTPPGRHQSLALTALQESMMWSNAAIACDTEGNQA